MTAPKNEFYVTLLSNSSMDLCPLNTQSKFQNYLKNQVALEGEWRVGVTEFYHNSFDEASNSNHMLFLHTDIIEPRLIGDQCSRVLRVVPVKHTAECMRFQHVEYVSLTNLCSISSISILINTETNQQANFVNSNNPSVITLHFVRYK